MSEWREIISQSDIDELLKIYRCFHDSCIAEISYCSGAFVDNEGNMHFGNSSEYEMRVIFHSQWEPKVIELCFSGLRQTHLTGHQDNYVCIISEAYLSFHDELLPGEPKRVIVWSDNYDFNVYSINKAIHVPADTYIIANSLKWRIVSE